MNLLSNVFSSPRTTLAGLGSVVLAAVGQAVVPPAVVYLGAQPGAGWQLVGLVLGALVGALMRDVKTSPQTSLPFPKP